MLNNPECTSTELGEPSLNIGIYLVEKEEVSGWHLTLLMHVQLAIRSSFFLIFLRRLTKSFCEWQLTWQTTKVQRVTCLFAGDLSLPGDPQGVSFKNQIQIPFRATEGWTTIGSQFLSKSVWFHRSRLTFFPITNQKPTEPQTETMEMWRSLLFPPDWRPEIAFNFSRKRIRPSEFEWNENLESKEQIHGQTFAFFSSIYSDSHDKFFLLFQGANADLGRGVLTLRRRIIPAIRGSLPRHFHTVSHITFLSQF